jgi:hypothetical protein
MAPHSRSGDHDRPLVNAERFRGRGLGPRVTVALGTRHSSIRTSSALQHVVDEHGIACRGPQTGPQCMCDRLEPTAIEQR